MVATTATDAVAAPLSRVGARAGVSVATIILALAALLAIDQVLLWRFLGLIGDLSALALILASGVAAVAAGRNAPRWAVDCVGWKTLGSAAALAFVLVLLGGGGRFLYVTTDWQVRFAVLRDLTLNPWPFVYAVRGAPDLLRAPLGMYLLPAATGKLIGGQYGAELALFVQNGAVLTALFAIAATWFDGARIRWIAALLFVGFSGMDAIGQLLAGQPLAMNPERWNVAVFSAHMSQIFWVPLHGFAGWGGAALYLLWRTRGMPIGWLLAAMPLLALWSPLALMGLLPFAAHAAIDAVLRRDLRPTDVILPAAATILSIPSLLYLASGSAAVGGSAAVLPLNHYIAFELIEVAPYLLGLWFIGRDTRFGGVATLAVVTVVLLAIPYGQIGESNDFMMRASPPALAILALMVIDRLLQPRTMREGPWRGVMRIALAIGAITPAFEVWHAVSLPPGPEVRCSYFGVVPGGYGTYVTPFARVSPLIAPRSPAMIRPNDPSPCWTGPWPGPMLSLDPPAGPS